MRGGALWQQEKGLPQSTIVTKQFRGAKQDLPERALTSSKVPFSKEIGLSPGIRRHSDICLECVTTCYKNSEERQFP